MKKAINIITSALGIAAILFGSYLYAKKKGHIKKIKCKICELCED